MSNKTRLVDVETLLRENEALRGLLEITPEVARCVRLMGMRHAGPVLVRPVEFSHDRAPLLEYFARIDAALKGTE